MVWRLEGLRYYSSLQAVRVISSTRSVFTWTKIHTSIPGIDTWNRYEYFLLTRDNMLNVPGMWQDV